MATESTKVETSAIVHLLAFFCGSLVNAWSAGYAILELGESTGAEFLPISVGILVDHEEREDNLEIIRRELLQPHVPHQQQTSPRHRLHQRPFRRRHHHQFRAHPLAKGVQYDPRSRLKGAGRLVADGYDDDDDDGDDDDDDDGEDEEDEFIAFHLARTFFNDSYSVSTAICKMLKSGITILIGSHSPGTLNTIKSYSDAFNIPYLTTGPAHNISRKGETFQLFMRPHVVLALRDLIRFKGWKDIHYLYDNEAGLERLQQLMELIQDGMDRVSVETLMLDKKTELVTNLSSIFQSDFLIQGKKRVFLDLSLDLLGAVLLKLGDEVRARSHHFVIVDLIISELDIDDSSAINVTGFRILDAQNATTRYYMKNLFRPTTASVAPLNVSSSRQRQPIPLPEKHPLLPQRRQQPMQPMSPGRFGQNGGGSDRFKWNSQIPKLRYETALLVDAVHLVRRALADLRSSKFKGFMGQGYSKLSRSLDCDADVVRPWRYGFQIIRNHLSMTDFYGLTGRVNFDDFGLRRTTHVELMEMTTTRSLAKVGWWNVQTGVYAVDKSYSRTREGERTTMMNKTRIITSILGAPYLMKCEGAKNSNNPNDVFEGYCAELAEKIARLVGFDYVIVPVKDEKFGAQVNNKSWNGMIGEIIRHEADLVIAPLTITLAREKVVDFSKPFMSLGISIMIKKPVKNDPSVVSFMKPLSNEIWMCVSFAYIGVSVVLFLVGRFSPDEGTVVEPHAGPVEVMTSRDYVSSSDSISSVNILDSHGSLFGKHNVAECRAGFCDIDGAYSASLRIEERQIQPIRPIIAHALSADDRAPCSPHPIGWRYDDVSYATGASTTADNDDDDLIVVDNKFTIFNSLWFSLGAFMQQGCDIEPRSLSGRIVGSVWWFFTLIIISSYTANLAAFLTVERMQSPIESADDLAKQSEIKYGPVDSGSTKDFFKSSKLPTYQRMWAFMESNDPSTIFVKSNDEGVERVRNSNGKYAFLAESTTLDYYNQRHPCDTMKVGSNLDSKGYGIATPLGSDLKDRITLAVLELLEDGELANLEAKWWQGKGECMKEGIPKKYELASSLKLSNILGIFYILLCGLLLATLLVLCEFLYACNVEANKKKVSFNAVALARLKFSISGTVGSYEPENLQTMCGENRERFYKATRKCSET